MINFKFLSFPDACKSNVLFVNFVETLYEIKSSSSENVKLPTAKLSLNDDYLKLSKGENVLTNKNKFNADLSNLEINVVNKNSALAQKKGVNLKISLSLALPLACASDSLQGEGLYNKNRTIHTLACPPYGLQPAVRLMSECYAHQGPKGRGTDENKKVNREVFGNMASLDVAPPVPDKASIRQHERVFKLRSEDTALCPSGMQSKNTKVLQIKFIKEKVNGPLTRPLTRKSEKNTSVESMLNATPTLLIKAPQNQKRAGRGWTKEVAKNFNIFWITALVLSFITPPILYKFSIDLGPYHKHIINICHTVFTYSIIWLFLINDFNRFFTAVLAATPININKKTVGFNVPGENEQEYEQVVNSQPQAGPSRLHFSRWSDAELEGEELPQQPKDTASRKFEPFQLTNIKQTLFNWKTTIRFNENNDFYRYDKSGTPFTKEEIEENHDKWSKNRGERNLEFQEGRLYLGKDLSEESNLISSNTREIKEKAVRRWYMEYILKPELLEDFNKKTSPIINLNKSENLKGIINNPSPTELLTQLQKIKDRNRNN